MNNLLRPSIKFLSAAALGGCLLLAPGLLAEQHFPLLAQDQPILAGRSQGYLGIDIRDIDTARAAQLHLKSTSGAEIITVDHDAPAARAGLRVHDVILQMNGQIIVGEAQLRQMLRLMPAGRVITLVICRDGRQQTLSVQLANRSTIEADAWSRHVPVPEPPNYDSGLSLPSTASSFGNSFLAGSGAAPLYTGLDLDILGPQLASYFGVRSGQGLLVRRVDENSPGSSAGLRAGDVIVRVNGKSISSPAEWEHVLHSNRGKPVHLTVFRNRKQETLTMTTGRPKTSGHLLLPAFPASWSPQQLARSMGRQLERLQSGTVQGISMLGREIAALHPHSLS
jgi:predicted metalloprotease with PDZ domain